ncbi:MAG TPA: hypothetical protein VM327_03015 [Candidatus Thermoplasmatota archaeon]|nr:hypothetical protein [Candidatus Thermoplasmatota archaeon]
MPLLTGARKPSARWLFPALALAAALVVAVPAFGFSKGICTGCEGASNAPPGDFEKFGCTACHGGHLKFPGVTNSGIAVQVADEKGVLLNGPYAAHGKYTINITFEETNHPEAANHAGFNLRASSGKLTAVTGVSQVSADGKQATHVNPTLTAWQVGWEAGEGGAVGFTLFVNDVDGSAAPDAPDEVHVVQFGLMDAEGHVVGSAAEAEPVEFGISLQQYWIGLIGLAGMLFVVVASFVYIKFVNPHNTDQKDR